MTRPLGARPTRSTIASTNEGIMLSDTEIERRLGVPTRSLSDDFYAKRPSWLTGYIGHLDARFLFREVISSGAEVVLEVGTASGLSAGLMCCALDEAHRAGLVGPEFKVV